MRPFDLFTTRTKDNSIMWPLCFAREFLGRCGNCYHVAKLLQDPTNIANTSPVNSGLDWEYIARVALAIVALLAVYRNANQLTARILGIPQGRKIKTCKFYQFGTDTQDPEKALIKVKRYATTNSWEYPLLVLGYPSNAGFTYFDTLTYFVESADSLPIAIDQQMKLSQGLPRKNPSKVFKGVVLLRGNVPRRCRVPRKRQRWDHLSRQEVKEFCPFSIRPLIPGEWQVSGEAQVKRACTKPTCARVRIFDCMYACICIHTHTLVQKLGELEKRREVVSVPPDWDKNQQNILRRCFSRGNFENISS